MNVKTHPPRWRAGAVRHHLGSLIKLVATACAILSLTRPACAQGVANVAAGGYHSLFLKQDGSVWATGANYYGQIGDGSNTNRQTSILVMTGVTAIASGWSHNLFLKADGTVWSVGIDLYGELGNNETSWGRNVPVQIMSGVKAISAATWHSLFLKTDGTVWSCGNNDYGRLGDGTTTNRSVPTQVLTETGPLTNVASISAGSYHSLFVKTDGTLWAAGSNDYGQFGNGGSGYSPYVIQVVDSSTNLPVTNIKAVSAGHVHSLWLKNDNTVWGTGANYSGQLGDGTTDNRHSPVHILPGKTFSRISAGMAHSLFVQSDSTLWAVGANDNGELGNGFTSWDPVIGWWVPVTVPVAVNYHVSEVYASDGFSLFVRTDGYAYGCGGNWSGQFGNGLIDDNTVYSTPTKLFVCSKYRRFTGAMSAGADSLLLKNDGTAWGMGTSYSSSPIPAWGPSDLVSVTQGTYNYYNTNAGVNTQMRTALKSDGTVWRWNGSNSPAAISGLSNVVSISDSPTNTSFLALRANGTLVVASSFYNYVNYDITDVIVTDQNHTFPIRDIVQISSSGTSHLALQNDGNVWAWGQNTYGELGDGTTTSREEPMRVLAGYYEPLTNVAAITSGTTFHCALKSDGTVWMWGRGYLGNGPFSTSSTPTQVNGLSGVVAISASNLQTFALKSDGTVVAWGTNKYGQLGIGSTALQNTPTPIPGLTGVLEVASCGQSTFFRLADGRVYACGHNGYYQLGLGGSSNAARLTPVLVNGY